MYLGSSIIGEEQPNPTFNIILKCSNSTFGQEENFYHLLPLHIFMKISFTFMASFFHLVVSTSSTKP